MAGTSAVPRLVTGRAADPDEATDDWNDKVAPTGLPVRAATWSAAAEDHRRRPGDGRQPRGNPGFPGPQGHRDQTGTIRHPALRGWPTPVLDQPGDSPAERVPESLIVLGGGAIGAELAQVFARFGTASPWSRHCRGWCRSRSPRPAS